MLSLRPAVESDVPYLIDLRTRTIAEHLERAGVRLMPGEHEERARSYLEVCSLVMLSERIVGMIKLEKAFSAWKVHQVQIEPDFQGRGIATQLLQQVIAEATESGVALELEVLKENPSLRLYERLGFKRTGEDEIEYHMRIVK
jgi:ribosomal protein S18 acetylase RimI-like enzyme